MTFFSGKSRALRFSSASTSHKSYRHITATEVRPFEAKRFTANQRDGLRFNLADVPCGLFAVHKLFRCCVPESDVGLCSGTHKLTYVVSAVM